MNWYKTQQQETDQFLNNSLYDGLSEADGIDLRIEMNRCLYGDGQRSPLGHWVVVRHFDRSKQSKYFNKFSKEGVQGPSHPFTDHLVRARRVPFPRSIEEDALKAGTIFSDEFIYYLEYTVPIRNGDQIYELDVDDHKFEPRNYDFNEKYDIKRLHPYRLENGNVQYYAALCEYDNITY